MFRIARVSACILLVVCALTAGCGKRSASPPHADARPRDQFDPATFNRRAAVLAQGYFGPDKPENGIKADAMGSFLAAKELYDAGHYAECRDALDAFWHRNPMGKVETWGKDDWPLGYVPLQVLTECARARAAPDWFRGKPDPLCMTGVFIGKTVFKDKTCLLDPRVTEDCPRFHRTVSLFGDYLEAMTGGRVQMQARVVLLRDFSTPYSEPGASGACNVLFVKVEEATPPEIRASTDIWWIFSPSHPDLSFFGGMTGFVGSPHFMSDEMGLLNVAHPEYDHITWLHHEFWHYLFVLYSEFELEKVDHQWWYRDRWPTDFVGYYEADYFYESLHKRIVPKGNPPLHEKLRGAPAHRSSSKSTP